MVDRWVRRTVLTAIVAAGALCAAGTVAAGPVRAVGGGVCMPWPDTELAAVASPMINEGPAPITVTQVALRDAYGVAIETAALAPHHMYPDGGGLAFGFGTYPPLEPELVRPVAPRRDGVGHRHPLRWTVMPLSPNVGSASRGGRLSFT
ncbi:hypothetical protein [Jiangella anatolica]|uniref:hypothetical protein n=1 Tax=Jiangella anatolica TaxID=2670374 RepID=UPI0011B3A53E|nr:hypothetical protein [Jiangella anatolica]